MQLYSEQYCKLNEELHKNNENYGKSGSKWASTVFKLATELKTKDILDYGCGKSTLSLHLPFSIQQYDPAIEAHKELPFPADIVVCTDVLEHIEPECLDNVLVHLKKLIKRIGILSASHMPAMKHLPDGRNAHVSLHSPSWWIKKILDYFDIKEFNKNEYECSFYVMPKSGD